jgi:ABC-type multidrug transport system fused ATPase/permease subunit
MEEKLSQSSLYQKRTNIKQEIRPIFLNPFQKEYIRTLLKRHSRLLKVALGLLLAITAIEIAIPLITNFYIKRYSYYLEIKSLTVSLLVLSIILLIYLALSYFSIRAEKKFSVYIMNDLRRDWFSFYLKKSPLALRGLDKGSFLTKISFHFSLLQMGLSSAFFPIFNIVFLSVGLILSGFLINTTLLVIVLSSLPIVFVIFFAGYIVSKYYISQDQTLYSKMLMYINEVFENFDTIKTRQKEFSVLKRFDKMVEIDSFFRIKRDLWLKYGSRIIFILVSSVAAFIYLFEVYYPFLKVENSAEYIVYGIFFSLIIKLFYESLRVGLFSFPMKLGACLSVPNEKIAYVSKPRPYFKVKKLSIKSKKVRLFSGGEYVKNIEFNFERGGRYLIYGSEGRGKTSLGYLLAGNLKIDLGKPWIFYLNGKRLLYTLWRQYSNNVYFVSPLYKAESTLIEVLTENKDQIDDKSFNEFVSILNKNKHFKFLFNHGRALGQKLSKTGFSSVENALLQLAYCFIKKPAVVVVDNLWIDIDDTRINETLSLLSDFSKDSIIICLSKKENKILNYDEKYSI